MRFTLIANIANVLNETESCFANSLMLSLNVRNGTSLFVIIIYKQGDKYGYVCKQYVACSER